MQNTFFSDKSNCPEEVSLLGIEWNRIEDTISSYRTNLNVEASTQKIILPTLIFVYDVLNVLAPLILIAKLFMQRLQCDPSFGWNDKLPESLLNEWKNIARQMNSTPFTTLRRLVGERISYFRFLGFTDASKDALCTVTYLKDLRSNQLSFYQ